MQSMIHVEQRAWIIEVSVSEVPSTVFVLVQYPVSSLAFTHVFFCFCFFLFFFANASVTTAVVFIHIMSHTDGMDGSVGYVLPVNEKTYRRLLRLQDKLMTFLPHYAGLHPKAFRLELVVFEVCFT